MKTYRAQRTLNICLHCSSTRTNNKRVPRSSNRWPLRLRTLSDSIQEAKALKQLLDCDIALYVIDARDTVHGKHKDELEILGRSSRPILPVLNFVADPEAKPDLWRDQLARVNLVV